LQQIIENSMTALDTWFFTATPEIWKALGPHWMCLHVSCTDGRITITDLGVGLTRADLINLLGIGKYHVPKKNKEKEKKQKKKKKTHPTQGDGDGDGDGDNEEEEDVTIETSDSDDHEMMKMMMMMKTKVVMMKAAVQDRS
jgi:hypothetical protein